jgi:thioester reductase-like protein
MTSHNAEQIFLTGASGYLGSHILAKLLQSSDTQVHCLVRARNATIGMARLETTLRHYRLWRESMRERIIPEPGDLEQAWLGLGRDRFVQLAELCDLVYHNGATVNYLMPYNQLHKANVQGTQEIIRLAGKRNIPVHYVSTLRLFDSRTDDVPIRENDPVDESKTMYSGYSQSKWVGEKLLRNAGQQGLPYAVYRPGLLCAAGEGWVSNENDAISLLIKACVQLGTAPISELQLYLTPVDFAVKGLVWLSRQPASLGQVFHLVNREPTQADRLFDGLVDEGYEINRLPYAQWVTLARIAAAAGKAVAMAPLLGYLTDELPEQSLHRLFDSRVTHECLAEAGLHCGALDTEQIRGMLRSMRHSGFLPSQESIAVGT